MKTTESRSLTVANPRRSFKYSAWRLARRIIYRNPLRHAIIAFLVAIPVFLVGAIGTLFYAASKPSPTEYANRVLSGFDGVLIDPSDPTFNAAQAMTLNADGDSESHAAAPGPNPEEDQRSSTFPAPANPNIRLNTQKLDSMGIDAEQAAKEARNHALCGEPPCDLTAAIPPGVSVTTVETVSVELLGMGQYSTVQTVIADFRNPKLLGKDGRFSLLDGAVADPEADEVMVTPQLAKLLDQARERAEARGKTTTAEGQVGILDPSRTGQQGTYQTFTITGQVSDNAEGWPQLSNILRLEPSSVPTLFVQEGSAIAKKLSGKGTQRLYLSGDVPDTYAQFLAYDRADVPALFRPVVDEFGHATAKKPFDLRYPLSSVMGAEQALPVGILAVVAFSEAILLSGFALTISARRQGTLLRQLSTMGAEPGVLRRVVLLVGIACGAVGSVLGGAVGALAGWLWIGAAETRHVVVFGPHVPWGEIFFTAVLALLAASVTSWWVGVRASRRVFANASSVAEVQPVRPLSQWGGWTLLITGLIASIALTIRGLSIETDEQLQGARVMLGGSQLLALFFMLAGVMFLTPSMVSSFSKWDRHLPFAFRLSVRDLSRRRGRSVPVLAVVVSITVAGVYGIVLLAVTKASLIEPSMDALAPDDRTGWVAVDDRTTLERKALTQGQVEGRTITVEKLAASEGIYAGGAAGVHTKIADIAQVPGAPQAERGWEVYQPLPTCATQFSSSCTELYPLYPEGSLCSLPIPMNPTLDGRVGALSKQVGDLTREQKSKCGGSATGVVTAVDLRYPTQTVVVVDPERPETMPSPLWGEDEAAEQALREGQALVFDPQYVAADGKIRLGEFSMNPADEGIDVGEQADTEVGVSSLNMRWPLWAPMTEHRIQAHVYQPKGVGARPIVVIPSSALEGTHQRMGLGGLLVKFRVPITDAQTQLVNEELASSNLQMDTNANLQPVADPFIWPVTGAAALMIVTVASLTAGIGVTDARRDQLLVLVMGSTGVLRRGFSAIQAFLLSTLGVLLGIVVALPPLIGYGLVELYTLSWIPWPQLLALLLAVPVGSTLVGWLLVPRLPSQRV